MLIATERLHIFIGLNEAIVKVRAEDVSNRLNTIISI